MRGLTRQQTMLSATGLAGTSLLAASLATGPGSRRFYALTLATGVTWLGGGLLSARLDSHGPESPVSRGDQPVVMPVATGLAAFGIFGLGAHVVRRIPPVNRAVTSALVYAERGSEPLVLFTTCLNGLGEEVFFRGALYAALPGADPVATSTAAYTLATTATRNPAMILAAGVMGTLFGYQRRATEGLQAPVLTHLTWSALMVSLLPRILRRARR